MDSTVSCEVTKRDSPALSQTSRGQWGKRVARYRVLWRRRQPKLLQGGGCVSWKERVFRSCAEKSWVQHFVIWSVKTEAWEGGASWMMQEWTSFRNTIGYQFGQMWEMDGMKICHPCQSYILCLQRIAHYRAGTLDEALRISAREATFPLKNMSFGHLWYITKFSVIRHRLPGFDIHFLSIQTYQRSHSLCGSPVLKIRAMAQEANT